MVNANADAALNTSQWVVTDLRISDPFKPPDVEPALQAHHRGSRDLM
jgi:hypothetical protein